jgi:hypothetical protein
MAAPEKPCSLISRTFRLTLSRTRSQKGWPKVSAGDVADVLRGVQLYHPIRTGVRHVHDGEAETRGHSRAQHSQMPGPSSLMFPEKEQTGPVPAGIAIKDDRG